MAKHKPTFETEHRELVVLREKNPAEGQPRTYVVPELLDLAQNLYFERIKLTKAGKDPYTQSAFMRYVLRAQHAKNPIIDANAAQQLRDDYDALSNGMIGLLPFESAYQAQMYYLHLTNRMAEAKMPPPMPQSKKHLCRSLADPKWEESWQVCDEKNEPGFSPSMKSKYPEDSNYKLAAFKWLIALAIAAGTAASIFFGLGLPLIPAVLIAAAIGFVVFLEKWNGNHSRLTLIARNLSRTFSGLYHHNRKLNIKDIVFSFLLIGTVVAMLGLTAKALVVKSIATMGLLGAAFFGFGTMVHNGGSLLDGARKLLEKLFGSFQFGFRSITRDAQLHTQIVTANFHALYGTPGKSVVSDSAISDSRVTENPNKEMTENLRILAGDMRAYLAQSLPKAQPVESFEKQEVESGAPNSEKPVSSLFKNIFQADHIICFQFEKNGHPASANTAQPDLAEHVVRVEAPLKLKAH